MEVQLLKKVADDIRLDAVVIDAVEYVTCCFYRQYWDDRLPAESGDSCDTRGDAEAYSLELTQLLHHRIDLLTICALWVKNRFSIVKDYEYLP